MCDTLVALNVGPRKDATIFGKNSDRPEDEAQIVSFVPRKLYSPGSEVSCTYIKIPQVRETAAVLLSQPYWMWGAEMGANEYGVVIGNEAVWTNQPIQSTGLLGMDLLRLGLERAKTAKDALDVIVKLLGEYGQGGACSVSGDMRYHNSFIIADGTEAWVLETADKWWVAEHITDGFRNISNNLSINSAGDLRKEGILDFAIKEGLCSSKEKFSFVKCFSDSPWYPSMSKQGREGQCFHLLKKHYAGFRPQDMMSILRSHKGGICMHGGFLSAGSQVSYLGSDQNLHWFTGTAPPCKSIFHPYTFSSECRGLTNSAPLETRDEARLWIKHHNWVHRLSHRKSASALKKLTALEEEESQRINKLMVEPQTKEDILLQNKSSWESFEALFTA